MKILAFSHTGLTTGGAEQCLIEYVDLLMSRGHECKVIIPHEGDMQRLLTSKKIENRVIGYGWAIRPHKKVDAHEIRASTGASLAQIFHEVEKTKPDVILVNTAVIPWGLYAGRIFGIPTVMLAHEIINERDPSLHVLPSYKSYIKILNENVDTVVYNSDFVKGEYEKDLNMPKTPKKILYPLPPLSAQLINKLYKDNVIGDTLQMAIFGALAPRKNQIETLEAIKILRDQGIKNIHVDFYGDAAANLPYVNQMRSYIKENSLGSLADIKGFTTSVYEAMNQYNVVISNSKYEPFGRTIIEGQLFGRIVIANSTGGGAELIKHGESGFLYKLGDAGSLAKQISWVIKHPGNAVTVGKTAKGDQKRKYLTNARYDALIEAVENSSRNSKGIGCEEDYFNPISALYEYNHVLNERYKKIARVINNRYTRAGRHATRRVVQIAKRRVKEILAYKLK